MHKEGMLYLVLHEWLSSQYEIEMRHLHFDLLSILVTWDNFGVIDIRL